MFMCRFYSGFFLFSCCCHTYWRTPTKYQENTQPPESNQWINYYKCLTSDWCCNENVIFIVMFLFFTISSIPSVWMACVRHKTWPLISIIFPIHIIYISIWFLNRFTLLHTFFFPFWNAKAADVQHFSIAWDKKKHTLTLTIEIFKIITTISVVKWNECHNDATIVRFGDHVNAIRISPLGPIIFFMKTFFPLLLLPDLQLLLFRLFFTMHRCYALLSPENKRFLNKTHRIRKKSIMWI